jgi:septal ring factor EnvC (AmiA/AmiB activator)
LLAIIPGLVLFYTGRYGERLDSISSFIVPIVLSSALLCGYAGYRVLRKYPENIMALRDYISELARGRLPESVILSETTESDDLKYIEKSFNALVLEMQKEITRSKNQFEQEHKLRETIERQQEQLVQVAHQQTMVDSIAVIYKRLDKPTEELHRQLHRLGDALPGHEQVECCLEKALTISNTLMKIRSAREFQNNSVSIGIAS